MSERGLVSIRERLENGESHLSKHASSDIRWLLSEVDTLRARITELTQSDPSWYDMSVSDAFRMWKADREELERVKTRLAEYKRDMRVCLRRESDLKDSRDRAESALSRCRADALEEAAMVADDMPTPGFAYDHKRDGYDQACGDIAAAIRSAAKDTTPAATNSAAGEAG